MSNLWNACDHCGSTKGWFTTYGRMSNGELDFFVTLCGVCTAIERGIAAMRSRLITRHLGRPAA
jgi:hypothetical protein